MPTKVVDGHCPMCGKSSTFYIDPTNIPNGEPWDKVEDRYSFDTISLFCAGNDRHRFFYHYLIDKKSITKYGQLPSLADIANDEARHYRNVLSKEDAAELHKAIGLAAHGVGIGSFVYLRRIFERLVIGRFAEFKESEGWTDEQFPQRMDERVESLKDHVPQFLVENRRLYAILSKGIHELSEEVCLAAFEPIKLSVKIILEEDKKKKEEMDLRKMAAAAIAKFAKEDD